jgi:hypothetical protein
VTKKMIPALALLAIVAALLMGVGAVWLTGEVLMFPLGVMPIALTGTGIVVYYELRTKRRLHALDKSQTRDRPRRSRKRSSPGG